MKKNDKEPIFEYEIAIKTINEALNKKNVSVFCPHYRDALPPNICQPRGGGV